MSSITGYRSGNPNLIYAGEVLRYGGSSPAAAPAAAAPNNGPNSQALTDFANQFQSGYKSLLDQQNAQQQGLFGQYTSAINSQEKLPELYTRLQSDLGLPGISSDLQGYKNEMYRVQGLLDRLDENVNSRNIGTYTTQAMRDRIAASEGGDLRTQLARLGTGMQPLTDQLTGAQNQLSALMPLYMQQQQKELSPLELQINALGDRFAREITGFTTGKQQQLTAILDDLQRGRQLADRDWDLAQQLAKEERDYQRNLKLAKTAAAAQSSYLMPSGGGVATSQASTSTRQLPQLASNLLSVQNAPNTFQITVPSSQLQGGSSGITLQGTSPYLQGGNVRLQ